MLSPLVAAPTLHHEAIDWATRVSANGGVISTNTIRAVSDLCRSADRDGWRSAMYRLNPFCGGNLSGCLVPLYRGPTFGGTNYGNATDTNFNFVSADFVETGATGGLKGNGTNKYLSTGFTSNSLPSATSVHLSASAVAMATAGDPVLLGSFNGTAAGLLVLDEFVVGSSARAFRHGTFAVGTFPLVSSPGATESHLIGSRTSSSSASLYRGGSLANVNATSVTPANNALNIYVFNYGTVSGTPAATQYSASRMRMYSIGTGVSATQAAAFSSAVIALNAALGR